MSEASPVWSVREGPKAERLLLRYLERNALGLGGLAGLHAVVYAIYGGGVAAGVLGVACLGAFAFARVAARSRERERYSRAVVLSGELLLVGASLATQLVMPAGPAAAIISLPLVCSILAFSQTWTRATGIFVLAVGAYLALPALGFDYPTGGPVPDVVSFSVTLVYVAVLLLVQVSRARGHITAALASIRESEAGLQREERRLGARAAELTDINHSLELGNARLSEALSRQAKLTEQLAHERDDEQQLTHHIHRDLQAPLREIVGLSEGLRDKILAHDGTDALGDYLGFAVDGGRRMTRMLDDLLAYTAEDLAEPSDPVDLNVVLASVASDLGNIVERTGAELRLADLPTVRGYATQLTQLFSNLITNALKFSRPGVPPVVSVGGHVVQDASGPGDYVVTVADNGIGIPANQLGKVFGLFNRAHQHEGYEGSGVGLALCRRIAIAHGAELSVTSAPGEGTTFRLRLPAACLMGEVASVPSTPSVAELTDAQLVAAA